MQIRVYLAIPKNGQHWISLTMRRCIIELKDTKAGVISATLYVTRMYYLWSPQRAAPIQELKE